MQMISIHKRLRAVAYAELLKWGRRKEMKISLNWDPGPDMTYSKFRERSCINDASGGRGFAQIVGVPSYGGGGWPNRHLGCKNAI